MILVSSDVPSSQCSDASVMCNQLRQSVPREELPTWLTPDSTGILRQYRQTNKAASTSQRARVFGVRASSGLELYVSLCRLSMPVLVRTVRRRGTLVSHVNLVQQASHQADLEEYNSEGIMQFELWSLGTLCLTSRTKQLTPWILNFCCESPATRAKDTVAASNTTCSRYSPSQFLETFVNDKPGSKKHSEHHLTESAAASLLSLSQLWDLPFTSKKRYYFLQFPGYIYNCPESI